MRIELRRKGATVSMKCSGHFPEKLEQDYSAGNIYSPVYHEPMVKVWFGLAGDNEFWNTEYNTEDKAKEIFEHIKKCALDYKKYCKELKV